MAAMMILMVVLLVMPATGGHMGAHGANDSSNPAAQAHENGAAKPDPATP